MAGHAGHSHGPKSGTRLWVSLIVTLAFVMGEAVAGWVSHSLALMSAAGHSLSDALALGLAAYAIWAASLPKTCSLEQCAVMCCFSCSATCAGRSSWPASSRSPCCLP